jgi:hypothetical protein
MVFVGQSAYLYRFNKPLTVKFPLLRQTNYTVTIHVLLIFTFLHNTSTTAASYIKQRLQKPTLLITPQKFLSSHDAIVGFHRNNVSACGLIRRRMNKHMHLASRVQK